MMSVEADSQDFVQDAKDRQALNDALDIKEKELTAARSRNYDLTKEIEALREQVEYLITVEPKQNEITMFLRLQSFKNRYIHVAYVYFACCYGNNNF